MHKYRVTVFLEDENLEYEVGLLRAIFETVVAMTAPAKVSVERDDADRQ